MTLKRFKKSVSLLTITQEKLAFWQQKLEMPHTFAEAQTAITVKLQLFAEVKF